MTVAELIEEPCAECEALSLWTIYITQLNEEFRKDILKDHKYEYEAEARFVCEQLLKRGHHVHMVKFQGVCRDRI